jgi:hypothetical protein
MKPKRPSLILLGLRIVGFTVAAIVTILLGAIPFLTGFLLQLITHGRLGDLALNAIGATITLVVWNFTGWVPVTIGDNLIWPSVVLSTVLGAGFAVSGGAISRIFFPRRSATSQ